MDEKYDDDDDDDDDGEMMKKMIVIEEEDDDDDDDDDDEAEDDNDVDDEVVVEDTCAGAEKLVCQLHQEWEQHQDMLTPCDRGYICREPLLFSAKICCNNFWEDANVSTKICEDLRAWGIQCSVFPVDSWVHTNGLMQQHAS